MKEVARNRKRDGRRQTVRENNIHFERKIVKARE